MFLYFLCNNAVHTVLCVARLTLSGELMVCLVRQILSDKLISRIGLMAFSDRPTLSDKLNFVCMRSSDAV